MALAACGDIAGADDGLVYVVDSRNGLYVLRYNGRRGEEIKARTFLEGNSNLGANAASE